MRLLRFELKPEHVKLLRSAYVGWQDCETGAPEIDPKRPYGNSSVARDVAEILGEPFDDEDEDQAHELLSLHRETAMALQVILGACSFDPGVYERANPYGRAPWRRVEGNHG